MSGRAKGGKRPPRPPRRGDGAEGRPARRDRVFRWIEVSAAAVAIVVFLYAMVTFLVARGDDLFGSDGNGQVEVRQVVVVNRPGDARLVDGGFLQTDASSPKVDVTVRNTGKSSVLLTGVRTTIEDSERLAVCEYNSGGPVPAARDYAIELPVLPTPAERVVYHPLHEEVPAGGVDRFQVLYRVPRGGEDRYVYALRVALVSEDSSRPVGVGRFVLGVPDAPIRGGGRLLPDGAFIPGASGPERLPSTWCFRRNLAAVHRLLARPGKRSSSLASLDRLRLAYWWPAFADKRPARAAVEPLFESEVGEGPVLAAFAAEHSGDEELAARTRRRAAAALLRSAEESLAGTYASYFQHAVISARYALRLAPSARAHEVLEEAETRLRAAEAEEPSSGGGD